MSAVVLWAVWLLRVALLRPPVAPRSALVRRLVPDLVKAPPLEPTTPPALRRVIGRAGTAIAHGLARASLGRCTVPPEVHPLLGGVSVLVAGSALFAGPGAAVAATAAGAIAVARRPRRIRAALARQLLDELPEAAECIALAVAGGSGLHAAIAHGARAVRGPLAVELVELGRRVARGDRLVHACGDLAVRHPELAPLTTALTASDRLGVPLAHALERLTADTRLLRRRRAEVRARRAPVAMLFPLVCCVLPAFALLAIVPMLVSGVGALHLP